MKKLATTTMLGMKKKDLIDYIRMLEDDLQSAEEQNERQYRNVQHYERVIHCRECTYYEDVDGINRCAVWQVLGTSAAPPANGYCHCANKKRSQ